MHRNCEELADMIDELGFPPVIPGVGEPPVYRYRPQCPNCPDDKEGMSRVLMDVSPSLAFWWCGGCGSILYITGNGEWGWNGVDAVSYFFGLNGSDVCSVTSTYKKGEGWTDDDGS